MGLKFDKKANTLDNIVKYTNFNFTRLKIDFKLIENYIFMLAKVAISHSCKF